MKRWVDETDDAFERALLRSARVDEPPHGSLEKAALALAGAAAVVTAATTTAATVGTVTTSTAPKAVALTKAGALALWKWIGLGVVAGAVVGAGTVSGIFAMRSSAGTNASSSVSTTTLNPPSSIVVVAPPFETSVAASALPDAEPIPSAAPRKEAPILSPPHDTSAPTTMAPPAAPNASALAIEAAALDRARQALAAGSPAAAISLLDTYERDAPTHALAPDAQVLRIEAEEARGHRAEAAKLGTQFLRDHPNDPHTERVRRLLDRVSKP